jgi:hypothetical protein
MKAAGRRDAGQTGRAFDLPAARLARPQGRTRGSRGTRRDRARPPAALRLSGRCEGLARTGRRVVEAQTAEEAMGKMDEELHVDLLVTDHIMPGMTGADLAKTVGRKWPGLSV